MAMKLDDSVVAMWQIELRLKAEDVAVEGNWVAILSKDDKGYVLDFRYRWYRDDEIGQDSKDTRHFYQARMGAEITDDDAAVRHAREVYDFTRKKSESSHSWELVRGKRTMDEFMELMATMPGMHMKKVSKKEAKKMGLLEDGA